MIKGSAALAGVSILGIPEWAFPTLAAEEIVIPFADMPENLPLKMGTDVQIIDVRKIKEVFTPKDEFYTVQHYGQPDVDAQTFRLKLSGLVERAGSFSIDDLRAMGGTDVVAGFECSGNRHPIQGLISNGRWTGVPLSTFLKKAGVTPQAREVVFFGADRGDEELDFRGQKFPVNQQFGRSLTLDKAMSPDPLLAYALNGEPLTRNQGKPLRLVVPGWYGVANVKWLSEIHIQDEPYVGKYQVRWYRTLKGEVINGETKWVETAITHLRIKSFIARVTKTGNDYKIFGVVLNDGTPLKSVEVRVDQGDWRPATFDTATSSKYSWKFFTYSWNDATPGEHKLTSRVTDVNGGVQPTEEELGDKKTFLEDNAQFPRTVTIS